MEFITVGDRLRIRVRLAGAAHRVTARGRGECIEAPPRREGDQVHDRHADGPGRAHADRTRTDLTARAPRADADSSGRARRRQHDDRQPLRGMARPCPDSMGHGQGPGRRMRGHHAGAGSPRKDRQITDRRVVGGQQRDPGVDGPLVSFEHAAAYEHVFANTVVPGLLQTREYALAIHQAREVRSSNEAIERMVDARVKRQESLHREHHAPALHLWVVLDEAVLHRTVGDAQIMARQLTHLHEAAQSPNVDIQILPFRAGAHAAGAGHFVILGKNDEREPLNSMAVVYIELRRRGLYLDSPEDVGAYKLTFDYLRSQAADTAASLRLIDRARQELPS